MASTEDVTTRAEFEAPICCNQKMAVDNFGGERGVNYRCKTCLSHAVGRHVDRIVKDIDNQTLKPAGRQEAPAVNRPAGTSAASANQEHNAAVLKGLLIDVGAVLHRSTDTINAMNRRNGALVGQVASAGEFAVATEQTDKSKLALDETAALTTGMDQHLGSLSTAVGEAEESVIAAIAGLRVVEEAEDELRQAGAGTKAAAPARDGA